MRTRHVSFTLLLSVLLAVGLTACASSGSSGPRRGSRDRITIEELEEWASQDLFTLVQRVRPSWMQVRAPVTSNGRPTIAVIVDGVRQAGSLEVLRSYRASEIEEVSYMNARDATTRYGTDMTAGAIVVVTKR